MSDEDFEIYKSAVRVKLEEKDLNLGMESARHWTELSTHKHNFNRQQE
jgi:secreted Zn-dependent insulinase-like peptidase